MMANLMCSQATADPPKSKLRVQHKATLTTLLPKLLVTTSKALVTTSVALVTISFLLNPTTKCSKEPRPKKYKPRRGPGILPHYLLWPRRTSESTRTGSACGCGCHSDRVESGRPQDLGRSFTQR